MSLDMPKPNEDWVYVITDAVVDGVHTHVAGTVGLERKCSQSALRPAKKKVNLEAVAERMRKKVQNKQKINIKSESDLAGIRLMMGNNHANI